MLQKVTFLNKEDVMLSGVTFLSFWEVLTPIEGFLVSALTVCVRVCVFCLWVVRALAVRGCLMRSVAGL